MALSSKHPWRRGAERLLSRVAAFTLAATVRPLPFRWVQAIGNFGGLLIYAASYRRRRLAHKNLIATFGEELSAGDRRRIIRRAGQSVAKMFLELFRMPTLGHEGIMRVCAFERMEVLHEALARGKGAIILSAHLGNWETGAACLAAEGVDIAVVARDASDAGVASLINRCRTDLQVKVLGRDETRGMLKHLRGNGALAILPDQHARRGSIRLDFLGRPAWTAKGPGTLAVRTGCALVPLFCVRKPDGNIRMYFVDEVEVDQSEDREEAIAVTTQRINDMIGEQVKAYPEQWLWYHNRWKGLPPCDDETGAS